MKVFMDVFLWSKYKVLGVLSENWHSCWHEIAWAPVFSVRKFFTTEIWLVKVQRSQLLWMLFKGEECLWKSPTLIDIIHKDKSHSECRITNSGRTVTIGKWSFSARDWFVFGGTGHHVPSYMLIFFSLSSVWSLNVKNPSFTSVKFLEPMSCTM